jgi:hypothetical protein
MVQVAAVVFAATIAVVVAFQLGLALGAPWGAYAMGGAVPGRFPPALRVVAVVQAVLLAALAVIVLGHAGIGASGLPESLVWGAVGTSFVALLLNAASRSAGERRLWVPVALVLLISSLVVALAAA